MHSNGQENSTEVHPTKTTSSAPVNVIELSDIHFDYKYHTRRLEFYRQSIYSEFWLVETSIKVAILTMAYEFAYGRYCTLS